MADKKANRYPYFAAETSAEVVIARIGADVDPRFREVMTAVIRHLHALVKEVRLTDDEWMAAIQFLTKTGQMCSDWRQEFILLSDTLGVSMLVDTLNHSHSETTENTVLGPFYVANPPHYENGRNICLDGKGEPMVVRGRVTDTSGAPIVGATVDAWQTNEDGFYDVQQKGVQPEMNLRGVFTTNDRGEYWFRSAKPRWYPIPGDGPVGAMLAAMGRSNIRPAHVHFIVRAAGYDDVVTHVFPPDCPYLDTDAVFGVKESLIGDFQRSEDKAEADRLGFPAPFWTLNWDFALAKAR
jgi:catechol 1,2-dioxygenase